MNRRLAAAVTIALLVLVFFPSEVPSVKAETRTQWIAFRYPSCFMNGPGAHCLIPFRGGNWRSYVEADHLGAYSSWEATALVSTGFYRYTGPTTTSGDATATCAYATNELDMWVDGSGVNRYRMRLMINHHSSGGARIGQTVYTAINMVNAEGHWVSLSAPGGPLAPHYGRFYNNDIYIFYSSANALTVNNGVECAPWPFDFICWRNAAHVTAPSGWLGDGVNVRYIW